MSRYMRITTVLLLEAAISFAAVSEVRSDVIFTPAAGTQTLATIDTSSFGVDTVGAFDAPPAAGADATLAISAAFSADGTKLYTLLNGVAENMTDVSSQLAIIDQDTGKIATVGDKHSFNLVAMEIDRDDTILATGFDLNPNPAFPGLNWFGNSMLYEIDRDSGALTLVGETNIADGPIMDLAFDAAGTLWATTRNRLWTVNTSTGASNHQADISGVTEGRPGAEIMGIYFDSNDTLFGTDVVTGDLFTINTSTGSATFVSASGLANPHGGDIFVPEPSGALAVAGLFCVCILYRRRRIRLGFLRIQQQRSGPREFAPRNLREERQSLSADAVSASKRRIRTAVFPASARAA